MKQHVDLIVMGGSWGGMQASQTILKELPADFSIPIVLVLHRLRSAEGDLQSLFAKKLTLHVQEIEEKEKLRGGYVYLAPANYHVLLENDFSFSLDSSEPENYSRPSIDVTFISAAQVAGPATAGILLSGASKDGSLGLKTIAEHGGVAIVQNPEEAEVATMPNSAISIVPNCKIFTLKNIKDFLLSLHDSQRSN